MSGQRQRRKILIVTDSFRIQTGFSNVGYHIADHLRQTDKWEVAYLGWFDTETKITMPGVKLYFTRKNNQGRIEEADKYSRFTFPKVVEKEMPDLCLGIGDCWMVENMCTSYNANMTTIGCYLPIDGDPVPLHTKHGGQMKLHWPTVLKSFNFVIAYGQYGMNAINATCGDGICRHWIHHGVESNTFRPLPEDRRQEIRESFFGLKPGAFLIGTVSRNQPRKAFDRLIEMFSRLVRKEDPDRPMWLYIHAPIEDVGWDLRHLCQYYHVQDRVILNESLQIGIGVTNEQLNEIYNAFHVFTLPTRGEGFGLPILEAMSCSVPCVVSEYSAHTEWCKPGSLFIKTQALVHEPLTNIRRCIVSIDSYVAQMYRLYRKPDLRKQLGLAGRRKAMSMDWRIICKQWEDLLDSIKTDKAHLEKDKSLMEKKLDKDSKIELVDI